MVSAPVIGLEIIKGKDSYFKEAYMRIIQRYGTIEPESYYYHRGRGYWVKVSVQKRMTRQNQGQNQQVVEQQVQQQVPSQPQRNDPFGGVINFGWLK
jgi:predicted RNA-binding protein YlxR (DUF448 family)